MLYALPQNITGIDDVGEAFSHLEAADWNLMVSVQVLCSPGLPALVVPPSPHMRGPNCVVVLSSSFPRRRP